MIIHCTQKLAGFWNIKLNNNLSEFDDSNTWNITNGIFNKKRFCVIAHEKTLFSFIFFQLNLKNFDQKFEEKIKFWINYYNLPKSAVSIFNTEEKIICKNSNKTLVSTMNRLKLEIKYALHYKENQNMDDLIFEVEKGMHTNIFSAYEFKYPIDLFKEFLKKKLN